VFGACHIAISGIDMYENGLDLLADALALFITGFNLLVLTLTPFIPDPIHSYFLGPACLSFLKYGKTTPLFRTVLRVHGWKVKSGQ